MTATTLALGAIRAFREHRFEMSDHGNKSGEDVESLRCQHFAVPHSCF
jgi:hypothetical protein